jgi:effector-binding domain-containing protein
MRKLTKVLLLLAVSVLVVVAAAEIYAGQTDAKSEVTIRKIEPQIVLYTIYRGEYQKIGQSIGNIYGLAVKNQIWPKGAISFVYLNNPQYVSGEHCLVEIRIQVGKEALKKAGTLGEMTDIKELKAMEVAVIKKPAGQMNYNSLYNSLDKWASQNGYRTTENACEIFAGSGGGANYSQMNSEIMVPIEKLSPTD